MTQRWTGYKSRPTNFFLTFCVCDSALHSCHDIVLRRSYLGSWGFSIVGGYEENHTNQPFFIKTIVLGTPAYYDGRLKWVLGDQIMWFMFIVMDTIWTRGQLQTQPLSSLVNRVSLERGCILLFAPPPWLPVSPSGSVESLWQRPDGPQRLKYLFTNQPRTSHIWTEASLWPSRRW